MQSGHTLVMTLPEEVVLLQDNFGLECNQHKEALKYTKKQIKPESRYKLKTFIEDEMINNIWYDRSLNHMRKWRGYHMDPRQASSLLMATTKSRSYEFDDKDKGTGKQ